MIIQNDSPVPKRASSLFTTILWSGFLVGTLDALGAILNYLVAGGKEPGKIFLFIASGVFGKDAYGANPAMVFLGILFHYIIAYLFTMFFFLIIKRRKWLFRNKLSAGVLYGIFIWLVMTFLVLPLTKIPSGTLHLKPALIGIAILIITIGIPLAYIANAYYSKPTAK